MKPFKMAKGTYSIEEAADRVQMWAKQAMSSDKLNDPIDANEAILATCNMVLTTAVLAEIAKDLAIRVRELESAE